MSIKKRQYEDNSVLALLYDEYKRAYPETIESIQREIEVLHEELYGTHLLNAEEVTAIFVGIGDDRCRCAHEAGVKMGVRLALDLELDSMMIGGGACVCNC
jgi:hypothetical protein